MFKVIRRTGRVLKKSLSVVLAFSMMISVCIVSGFSVSANSFIEVYFENSSNWSRVNAYAWNSSSGEKLLGDFPGTKMTFVEDNVYKISVSVSADKIIFNGGSGTQQTGDITLPAQSGKIYKNSAWSDYSEGGTVGGGTFEYTAKTDSSFNNVNYTASCSLYDYLGDQELSSGIWGNVESAGNSATWYPFSKYNSILSDYYKDNNIKKPLYYGNFNTGSAGENDRKNTYNTQKASLYGYDAAPNNSKAVWYDTNGTDVNNSDVLASCGDPPSWDYSYQGVVSRNLDDGGNLMMVKNDDSDSAQAPFFSDSFLNRQYSGTGTTLGRKVNTVLPFTYDGGSKKYSYKSSTTSTHQYPVNGVYLSNSGRGSSVNNLNGVTDDSLTMMYGGNSTSTAILDGKKWFNSGESGYGFFPFNNNTGSHSHDDVRNDLNYGFGMALTVDFTVPTDGCVEGTSNPVEFTFTGDDDVWIFIDGKLVVDLGGDHKDASCTLDFKNNITRYSTGVNSKAVTNASKAYSLEEVMAGSTKNTVHTLKMFYMERGLIESNLQVEFSFSPIDNYLTTTKTVDTTDVNLGIKSAVSNTDDFKFTNVSNGVSNDVTAPLSGKSYSHTAKNNVESARVSASDGSYIMKDGETAAFTNIIDTGNYITVSESTSDNVFDYTSKYTVTDVQNGVVKADGVAGTEANFLFKNEVNDKQATNFRVDFVNKPQVNNLSVTKIAKDSAGQPITNKEFDFFIALALDGTENYQSYPLVYEVGDAQYTADGGHFKLKGGQTAAFKDIPVGAKYFVTEGADIDYVTEPSNRTFKGEVNGTANAVTFVNTKIDKSPASVDLSAVKLLDGKTPDVNIFEFTLKELSLSGSGFAEGKTVQTVYNSKGIVSFDTIQYEYIDEPTEPATELPTVQPTTAAPTTEPPATAPPTTAPQSDKTVYLKPNANWISNSARFALYVFNDSGYAWVSMTSAGNGTYKAELPDGEWSKLIFCRMANDELENNWANKWNQTSDLDIPTGTNRCYTVADGAWDKGNGSWGAVPSAARMKAARYSLFNSEPLEKHYYKISEKAGSLGDTYVYDSAEYYVVVTVDRNAAPITASAKYYKSASDAISETSDISPDDVEFNNYHKGSVEITKKSGDGSIIGDSVKFRLYKAESNGGELLDANLIGEKTVDKNGVVTFKDLDLFVNQAVNDTSEYQWYCFIESEAKDGFNINGTKYYFTIPLAQVNEDQGGDSFDFESDGVKYSYVLKNGKPVYDIKCDVDNFPVVTPNTSGSGVNAFLIIGLGIIGTGAATVIAYTLYDRAQRRKRRARRYSCN